MRLGTCLLYEGHTIQDARTKMAYFCSAPMEGFYAAVDRCKLLQNIVNTELEAVGMGQTELWDCYS